MPTPEMSDATTEGVRVGATAFFLPEQSEPEERKFLFGYTIVIANQGDAPVQLVSRHWVIIDADQRVQEVKGVGVVGQQPVLKPGETFEYTSGASLATAVGTMKGTYQMLAEDGRPFDATIPQFTLSVPRTLH